MNQTFNPVARRDGSSAGNSAIAVKIGGELAGCFCEETMMNIICEVFGQDLQDWKDRFPGSAVQKTTTRHSELIDVPEDDREAGLVAMRWNCSTLIGCLRFWDVPSPILLEYQNATFAKEEK